MTKRRKAGLILAAVFGAMTLVTSIALPIGYHYESVIDEFLGTSEYAIKKKSSDSEAAMPYKSEFNSVEELREKEAHVNRQMEGEGLTLLKNENNALPLVKGSKFSVFGNGLFDPVLSGTGSGAIKQGEDSYTLTKALNESFGAKSVNSVLRNKYKDLKEKYHSVNANIATGKSSDFQVNEAPWSEVVDQEVRESFKDYSECALFIITRRGGEGTDLPDGSSEELKSSDPTTIDGDFLRLTTTEKDIFAQIKKLKEEGVFRKFVVLINSSNALQLDFLDDEGIDACMWIGTVGNNGLAAVGDALVGDINPSGRLADTFLIDNHSSLSMRNFGIFEYENPNNYDLGKAISNSDLVGDYDKCNQDYLVYQESIYVGYKYFETRYEDSVKSQNNPGEYRYYDCVKYPFGYGLSYTTFEYENFTIEDKGENLLFHLDVRNTGSVEGKHTVELYMQSPYTQFDKENKIEKASVQLIGFEKTEILKPKESESITIAVPKKEMACYDANANKTYILEEGDYHFTIGKDSHDAINNILAKEGYSKQSSAGKMTDDGNKDFVLTYHVEKTDATSYSESNGVKITNQFDDVDVTKYEGTKDQGVSYVSRKDWEGTIPSSHAQLAVNERMWKDGLTNNPGERKAIADKMEEKYYSNIEMPLMEQKNNLSLVMLMETEYEDELWDKYITQASFEDMKKLTSKAFYHNEAVESLGLPEGNGADGILGYTKSLMGGNSSWGYVSEDVRAASFNKELNYELAKCFGEDNLYAYTSIKHGETEIGNVAIYAPGCDLHRTSYGGRNFEYYSEDGFLSSEIVKPTIKGLKEKGVNTYCKHIALNESEDYRYGLSIFADEQSIREIYLKGFQGAAYEGSGFMTSFCRFGVTWSGAHYGLMHNVVREEWGCKEAIVTDMAINADFMDYRAGLLAGNDLWLSYGLDDQMDTIKGLESNPATVYSLQMATKHLSYSLSRSLSMNGLSSDDEIVSILPWWKTTLICLDVFFGLLFIAGLVLVLIPEKKRNQGQ